MSKLIDLVNAGKWRELFIEELGWTRPSLSPVTITLPEPDDEHDVLCTEIAQFKGVRIWLCNDLLDSRTQRYIDKEIKKHSTERLIIFAGEIEQEWRWPQSSDNQGRGKTRLVSHRHMIGHENQALEQRLAMIEIKVTESPGVIEVLRRLRAAFDADRITKAFYDKFSKRHEALVKAIKGLPDYEHERTDNDKKTKNQERKWYSSLLLNRLMFIYFLQRKGFMDNDRDYLRNRLDSVKKLSGENHFFEFYADFLIPMFHDGLGEPGLAIKNPDIKKIIGDIPYINGGIFSVHELERTYGEIHIDDDVFKEIFDLFDSYQWHLDDRPTGNPNEINPDVLGHIFEQFINQKQMGAYYTKEDVTHFMTSSTLLPVFLDRVERQTGVNPWAYLAADPQRYVWESVSFGLASPYPEEITAQVDQFPRPAWNEKASEEWGLPGETWWEVDHRHRNYERIVASAKAGDISSADAAVTANIDLETLAIDVIDGLDAPKDVVAVWNILSDLKIIDPTCGSGAFLFAALKTLLNLYDAILDTARSHAVTSTDTELAALIAEVDAPRHKQSYFILKHAALHNLYGVDIMKEATEIARLRLFLKLVAAIDDRKDLEPLPDLDFNIKPGNILVGALNAEELTFAADVLTAADVVEQANASAEVVALAYDAFRAGSEAGDENTIKTTRKALSSALSSARLAINRTYFGGQSASRLGLDEWVKSHVPFHWFIEFPEVFTNGGFDVVIGNPPYIAKNKVTDYKFGGFETASLPDIYAPCTERASQITRSDGRMSLIVPISAQFGSDYAKLRSHLERRFASLWVSAFSRNPAALFSAGLGVRSTIVVAAGSSAKKASLHVTKTHRWVEGYRPSLFETISYSDLGPVRAKVGWARVPNDGVRDVFVTIAEGQSLASLVSRSASVQLGFKNIALYWLVAFLEDPPAYNADMSPFVDNPIKHVRISTMDAAKLVLSIASSKLGFVWWYATGDDFNVTSSSITGIPVDPSSLSAEAKGQLVLLADELAADFPNHVLFTKYAGKWMGNYVLSEMRDITDQIDLILAQELGYEDLLPALEHAYYCVYKPTGDRPGTLRYDPSKEVRDSGGHDDR